MKNNEYGDSVAAVIVNADGELVAQELENGFDKGAMEAIQEYLAEKGMTWEPEHPESEQGTSLEKKLSARLSSHIILCDGTWRCG